MMSKEAYDNEIKEFIKICAKLEKDTTNYGYRIGGSELSSLLGCNIFCPKEQLAARKLKLIKQTFTMDCMWGIMFEPIVVKLINDICTTEVHGNNIKILGEIKNAPHIIHKPDGLCVIGLKRVPNGHWTTKFDIDDPSCETKYIKTVIEIKAPLSRLNNSTTVPEYYRSQMESGLALSTDYMDMGLYVEAYIRVCSMKQLTEPLEYNLNVHLQDKNKDTSKFEDYKFGYIYIIVGSNENKFRDLGECTLYQLKKLFKMIYDRQATYMFIDHFDVNRDNPLTIDKLKTMGPKTGVVGILPWKLFRISFAPVQKTSYSEDYVETIEKKSADFIEILNKIKNSDNMEEEFDKYFGSLMLFDNNKTFLQLFD